jgi:thymidylate kinase
MHPPEVKGIEAGVGGGPRPARTPATPPPLIIEFVGLPGAGKSSVAEHVIPRLRERGIVCGDKWTITTGARVEGRLGRYVRVAAFAARHPGVLAATARHALALRPFAREQLRRATRPLYWGYRLATASTEGYTAVVMHEGPLHDAWCSLLGTRGHSPAALRLLVRRLAQAVPYRVVYVHFRLPIDVALARVVARSTTRLFNSANPDISRRLLLAHGPALQGVLEEAVRATGARCGVVDATRSFDQVCRDTLECLDALLSPRSPAPLT